MLKQPFFTLSGEQAEPFRKQITKPNCRFCHKSLANKPIKGWGPHEGGWNVEGIEGKVWLYIECACGQQWALHYLGVSR